MRVRLTKAQYEVCLERAAGLPWPLVETLQRDVQPHARTRIDVAMPAIAWVRVRDSLYDVAYTRKGFKSREAPERLVRALRAVQGNLNTWESHPAMSGAALLGLHATLIPVWRDQNNGWSIYPVEGSAMEMLTPEHILVSGHRYTRWAPQPGGNVGGSFIFVEAEHLRFCG